MTLEHYVLALMLTCASVSGCASGSNQKTDPSPTGASAVSCAKWGGLTDDQRHFVIGSALEQKVGAPRKSAFSACMWTNGQVVQDHVTARCAKGGVPYEKAVGEAFDGAISHCRGQ
jgi:hypothetical protein